MQGTTVGNGSRAARRVGADWIAGALCAGALCAGARAAEPRPLQAGAPADAYHAVPLAELRFVGGEEPPSAAHRASYYLRWPPADPRVELDGAGEAYLDLGGQGAEQDPDPEVRLTARAPAGAPLTGTLWLPAPRGAAGLTPHRFALDELPAAGGGDAARGAFLGARHGHYDRLFRRGLPGAAWFRHRAQESADALRAAGFPVPAQGARDWRVDWRRQSELEDSYELFTGGRALSENLQLDRVLEPGEPQGEPVPLADLEGITVEEFDWSARTAALDPQLDPLAAAIPADQHALFFPSFSALVTLVDEAVTNGTPILHLLEPRAEDARTLERYERQLCLSLDDLARTFGDALVKSVAVTGSDPYLRTGSDVALLFEARDPELFLRLVQERQRAAVEGRDPASIDVDASGLRVVGVSTGDWEVSSFAARVGDFVVVSNTLEQLVRAMAAHSGEAPSLAGLPEYRFFRDRYRRTSGETAFLMLSDATIRRWCSPKWRVGAARRTRAAAVLAEDTAANLPEIAAGAAPARELRGVLPVPGGGRVWLEGDRVRSETYGTLDFLTPIAQLEFESVTAEEARQYRRYRNLYQQQWRQWFDPIAARIEVEDDRLDVDLSVMPLIAASDYREMIDLTRGVALDPFAGDPHAAAMMHYVLALNHESRTFREARDFLSVLDSRIGSGLDWVGDSFELWIDADPVFEGLRDVEDVEEFVGEHVAELPIALRVESRSPLKLAAFLTGMRAFIDQSAPGLLTWQTREHAGGAYVVIRPVPDEVRGLDLERLGVYYAALPGALVVSLREDVVQRAIERAVARREGGVPEEAGAPARAWTGASSALRVEREAVLLLLELFGGRWREDLQRTAWDALPILEEWRRLFPDQDPVEVHARLWGVRPVDPGGGAYVWDPERRAMRSTVFGSPAAPEMKLALPAALDRLLFLDAGVTFEDDGLRARAVLGRRVD